MSQHLKLENLAQYDDGSLRLMVNQALRSIYLDLYDRPRLKTKRKLVIEMDFVPSTEDRELEEIRCSSRVICKVPPREPRVNVLLPSRADGGGILFDPDTKRTKSLEGQEALPFEGEEEAGAE